MNPRVRQKAPDIGSLFAGSKTFLFLKSLCYNQNNMGLGINNIQNNLNTNSFTYEQAGISSTGPTIQIKRKIRPTFLIIIIAIIILVAFGIFFILNSPKQKRIGSRKKEDLISFIKLYQYGDMNDKKDINTNLPANYTYAYKMLSENYSDKKQKEYADLMTSSLLKYSNQEIVYDFLLYYTQNLQLYANLDKIKNEYLNNGSESTNKLIENMSGDFKNIKVDYLKDRFDLMTELFKNTVKYYSLIEKANCIKDKEVDNACEVRIRNDDIYQLEIYNTFSDINDAESVIAERQLDFSVKFNDILINFYKINTASNEKGTENAKTKK